MDFLANFFTSSMGWSIIIFLVIYVLIATNMFDLTVLTFIGTFLVVALGLVSYHHALSSIDMNVILLLVGMMIIVGILAETGVFEWLAIKVAKASKGNAMLIILMFMLITAVLSAFLDNVTTIILMAPITILLTQILEVPTAPILIMEAIFCNLGGTATMIGDPPNIILGSQTSFGFNDFLIHLGPLVVVLLIVMIVGMYFFMRKTLATSQDSKDRVMASRPECAIIQPVVLKRALPVFALVLVGFFTGTLTGIEPGMVAMVGAAIMALVCKINLENIMHHVEWNTILFFVGLFMLMSALSYNGVFEKLGNLIVLVSGGSLFMATILLLWFSTLVSTVVNSIPLVLALIPVAKGMIPVFAAHMGLEGMDAEIVKQIESPLVWALALGTCLGSNGTLVSSAGNILIAQIGNRNGAPINFMRFTKYGFPITILTVIIATFYMWLRYF